MYYIAHYNHNLGQTTLGLPWHTLEEAKADLANCKRVSPEAYLHARIVKDVDA